MSFVQTYPSEVISQIACYPGTLYGQYFADKYGYTSGAMSKLIRPLYGRNWLVAVDDSRPAINGAGRRPSRLSPSNTFWNDFIVAKNAITETLTANEKKIYSNAIEEGIQAKKMPEDFSDNLDFMYSKTCFLGAAALLSEKYNLANAGWLGDERSWQSFMTIDMQQVTTGDGVKG